MEADRERALAKVKAPAICLMIYAGIAACFFLMSLAQIVMGSDYTPMPGMSPEAAEIAKKVYGPSQKFSAGMNLLAAIIMFAGGWKMMSLKNYGLAIAASICAFLPCSCPCCFIGIGFGIWSLVVLSKSDVKSQFS